MFFWVHCRTKKFTNDRGNSSLHSSGALFSDSEKKNVFYLSEHKYVSIQKLLKNWKTKSAWAWGFFTINMIQKRILLKLAAEDKFEKYKKCCVLRTDWSVRPGFVLWFVPHREHTCLLVKQVDLRFYIKKLHQRAWF